MGALPSFRWSAWGQEYCATLGAIVALAAMIVLLTEFDGKDIWDDTITLNAIVSILSVTVKAAIGFVLSECMAQWKWILFSRGERPLIDFDRIDGATRGPLGSLRVLLRTKRAFTTQFGAVLTLLAVGLDPFAQQLIQLRGDVRFQDSTDGGSFALISGTESYTLGNVSRTRNQENSSLTDVSTSLTLSMEGAILNSLYKSVVEFERETLFRCPTGNCTFGPSNTLGICYRCSDVSSDLKHRTENFRGVLDVIQGGPGLGRNTIGHATAVALPNGHFIANPDCCATYGDSDDGERYIMTSFGTGKPKETVSMKDIDSLLWSMSFIYPDKGALNQSGSFHGNQLILENWPAVPLKASECAVYYCVKQFTSVVQSNQLTEDIIEVAGTTKVPGSWDDGLEFSSTALGTPSSEPLELEVPNRGGRVSVGADSVLSLSDHFQRILRWGFWYNNAATRKQLEKIPGMESAVGFNGAYFGAGGSRGRVTDTEARPDRLDRFIWSENRVNAIFEALAVSMTNEMRRNSEDRDGTETMKYHGKVGVNVVVYEVGWPWIVLHITTLLSTCLLLVLTIRGTNRDVDVPLWKSSSLAAIRRGHDVGSLLSDAGTAVADMEDTARKVYVGSGRRDDGEEMKLSTDQSADRGRVEDASLDGELQQRQR